MWPAPLRTGRPIVGGIAGGFFVFRAAAAAAHEGLAIGEVERIATKLNAATFSFGVAFGGCTFPGRTEPLFTVEAGHIELGLGIHGERGIAAVEWMPAEDLATAIIEPLLSERPRGGTRAAVLLNGLGDTKYEELFVLYRTISRRLALEGVEIVDPEVGEYVTSLDMAGCSLTLSWLDEETERLLRAPASAPGYRTGRTRGPLPKPIRRSRMRRAAVPNASSPGGTDRSAERTRAAGVAVAAFVAMADAMSEMEAELGRLDSVAGDGDHGAGMVRGTRAAAAAAAVAGPAAADVLRSAALAFSDAAGGASGALWGAGLLAASGVLDSAKETAKDPVLDVATVHGALVAALEAVMRLGRAAPGDKTMIDALAPFVDAFRVSAHASIASTWAAAAIIAEEGAAATAGLAARKGRAAIHGDQSKGTPDPGAVSLAAALVAAGEVIQRHCGANAVEGGGSARKIAKINTLDGAR